MYTSINKAVRITVCLLMVCEVLFLVSPLRAEETPPGVLYLTHRHPVYQLLERLHTKGFLPNAPLGTRPWTRMQVAEILSEIDTHDHRLTSVDRQRLEFYAGEFADELRVLGRDSLLQTVEPAWWTLAGRDSCPGYLKPLATHGDSRSSLRLKGAVGYSFVTDTSTTYRRHWEAGGRIRIADSWGAQASMVDIATWGDDVVPPAPFSPEQGVAYIDGDSSGTIYYDDPVAEVTYGSRYYTVSLGTMPVVFGTAADGNIVLSGNAPPIPHVRITAHPWRWLTFTYLHMTLQSGVADSQSIWTASADFQSQHIRKYCVAHRIEYTGIDGVNLAVGESIIYGGRGTETMYLIPVVPFRAAQHDVGDLDNLQMWADFSIARIPWTRLYGAIIIDELRITTATDNEDHHNWWAWQLGLQIADFWGYVPDADLTLEYTHANPWVYHHRYPWNTYDTWAMRGNDPITAYPLGYWMGHNGDVLYGGIAWRARPSLEFSLWGRHTRRGAEGNTDLQYTAPSESFLFGAVTKTTELSLDFSWEILRDVVLEGGCGYKRQSGDVVTTRDWITGHAGLTYDVW